MTKCPNCTQKLSSRFDFCPFCGEELNRHKFTFKHISSELIEGFTHLDFKIIHYLKTLLTKPSLIVYEYTHGKKKKYFNPFVAFVLFASLYVFYAGYSVHLNFEYLENLVVLQKNNLGIEQYNQSIKYLKDAETISKKMLSINKYFHAINLFIYAIPFWIIIYYFFNKAYNYIETVFGMMIFWNLALLTYLFEGIIKDVCLIKFNFRLNSEYFTSGLLSILAAFMFYKLLDVQQKKYWLLIFAILFFLIDNFVIPPIIEMVWMYLK